MAAPQDPPDPGGHRIHYHLPWQRLPAESDEAWQAFIEYRDMGLSRSAQRVADIVGKSLSHVHHYSCRHHWRERVAAYERHLDAHRQDEHEKAVRKMAKNHVAVAQLMLRRAAEVIDRADRVDITVRDAIAMFRAAVPVERMGRASHQAFVPREGAAHLTPDDDADDDDWDEEAPRAG